jgi:hypothetical protein
MNDELEGMCNWMAVAYLMVLFEATLAPVLISSML